VAIVLCIVSGSAVLWLVVFKSGGAATVASQPKAAEATPAVVAAEAKEPESQTRISPRQTGQPVLPDTSPRRQPQAIASRLAPAPPDTSQPSVAPPLDSPPVESERSIPGPSKADVFVAIAPLATATLAPATERQAAATIYSRDDGDVQPPVMVSPQLPPPLMVGTPSEGVLNRMELVVAADGTVERVRLMDTPRRMADMMLLSGAKLWKFTPAVRKGEPVRYRTIVSWSAFP
jgi:hypothetical protein